MTHSRIIATLLLFTSITACTQPIAPPSGSGPKLTPVGAPFTLEFTGLGTPNLEAKITSRSSAAVSTQALTNQQGIVTPIRVTAKATVDVIPASGIREDGFRYVYAVVSVTSTQALSNVSFLGVRTTNSLPLGNNDTAISNAVRASGGAPYSASELAALVVSIKPAQAISGVNGSTGELNTLANTEDSVQYLPEADVTLVPPGMVGLLPYGFTVLNGTGGRTLGTNAEVNRMVVGMKVPLAALATDDPAAFSFTAIPVSDSVTRVTQSLEAQTPAGNAAVVARAAALGAGTTITMLPSPQLAPLSNNPINALCTVRTAGPVSPGANPTTYLINRVPSSTTMSSVVRVMGQGQTLSANLKDTDTDGTYYLPAATSLPSQSPPTSSNGTITVNTAGVTSATLSACGSSINASVRVLAPTAQVLAGGLGHSLAIKSDDTVAAWGSDSNDQRNVPTGLTNVTAVSGGQFSSLALNSGGTVTAWGYRFTNGAFGLNDATVVASLTNIIAISAGNEHGLALDANGAVTAWGLDTSTQATVPSGLTSNVVAVSAGFNHSLALKSNGMVVPWGNDTSQQVSGIPIGLSDVVAISGGDNHSLALKKDGTVIAWGNNLLGQLNIPSDLSSVVAISAGGNHNLAVKSDGTVVAWGSFGNGQIAVPSNLTNVVAVSASGDHSLALKDDGSIVSWGFNGSGQVSTTPAGPFKLP